MVVDRLANAVMAKVYRGKLMRIATITAVSIFALAACSPEIPNSAAGAGASADVTNSTVSTLPRASAVATQSLDSSSPEAIAAETTAALGLAPATAPATAAPLSAMASSAVTETAPAADGAPAPVATISDEQNFTAVAERETIESDAERIAANRAQYVTIEPTALPPRPDGSGASIVAYALATTNDPGQPLYSRMGLAAQTRFDNACAKYGSADRAQEAFLDAGGPQRDRYGMDPDGDGFACYWDPRPFRAAREGAPEEVETYVVIETNGEG